MRISRPTIRPLAAVAVVAGFLYLAAAVSVANAQSGGSGGSSGGGSTGSGGSSGGSSSSLLGGSSGGGGSTGAGGSSSSSGSNSLNTNVTGSNSLFNSPNMSSTTVTPKNQVGGKSSPSASNIIGPYYVNPISVGNPSTYSPQGSNTTQSTFLAPIFDTSILGNGNSANVNRGASGGGNVGSAATTSIRQGPRYTLAAGWQAPRVAPTRMATDLQQVIASSTRLSAPGNIKVDVENGTVVLRGTAADEHEKTLAAAVIGMAPGVYDVRNELKVGAGAGPATVPAGTPAVPAGQPGRGP
jgi:BON domain